MNRLSLTYYVAMFFAATEEELVKAAEPLDDSAKLADGGYIAALGVYHEIHCLVCSSQAIAIECPYSLKCSVSSDFSCIMRSSTRTSLMPTSSTYTVILASTLDVWKKPELTNTSKDHCLETIRVSLMCSADLSIYTFKWREHDPDRPHPRTHGVRKCADWRSVETWATSRKIPLDPMLLRPEGIAAHIHM